MSSTNHLTGMANDIAAYFAAEPDHAAAVEAMVLHLQRFWEPRMRLRIVEHVRGGGDDLAPLAHEAIVELGKRLGETPPPPRPQGGGDAG
jgi:formate dehydrogenase subunit delta